jgi:uncharacterized membrane protein
VEIKDKQPKFIKLPPRIASRRFLRYGLVIVTLIIVVGALSGVIIFIKHGTDSNRNTHLSKTTKQLSTSWHSCSEGMKQLGSVVNSKFAQDTSYSRSVREQVLGYIAPCEFAEGHSTQALAYANQLEGLYRQDGANGAKSYQRWQATIQYIKEYSQK